MSDQRHGPIAATYSIPERIASHVFTHAGFAEGPCGGRHGTHDGAGGVRLQSGGVIQQIPGPGAPHVCMGIGLRCEHDAPVIPQSALVVHVRTFTAHSFKLVAETPCCLRRQSCQ